MRQLLSYSRSTISLLALCGVIVSSLSGTLNVVPWSVAVAAQTDVQGTCYLLSDRVDGEPVSTPIFVSGGIASASDAETRCADEKVSENHVTLTVYATGTPDFRQNESLVTSIDVTPGSVVSLRFVVPGLDASAGGARLAYVDAPIRWSLTTSEQAAIIPDTGELLISSNAQNGFSFTAHGEVELAGAVHVRDIAVRIFTREANPLVGAWREVSRINCEDGSEAVSDFALKFLVFSASGRFRVVLSDNDDFVADSGSLNLYEGVYSVDAVAQTLNLVASGSGDSPPDFDGVGTFQIDEAGSLVLTDFWFDGSDPLSESICGIRFELSS